jgi:chromate reductase
VERLKAAVAAADALFLATPEYNYSVPGVLVNALDWLSRPAFASPLKYKPTGVVSASPGALGGARGQQVLKSILQSTGALVMPHRGVVVTRAADKFDGGRLTDERTRGFLAAYLRDLEAWARRLATASPSDPT